MNNRDDLIRELAKGFEKEDGSLAIERSNYISSTGTLDCTAESISVENLEKTLNVIKQHERKFVKEHNEKAQQILIHLQIARKCVEKTIIENSRK